MLTKDSFMKKFIEISEENLKAIKNGKYVEGSLHYDKEAGKIIFKSWNRKSPKNPKNRVICYHENGWLKESATRIKFYNSVKKDLGFRLVNVAMHRDLKDAMSTLEVRDLINRV